MPLMQVWFGKTCRSIPAQNIIAEPCVRDTAGAIGLAASVLIKRDADATMAVVTADQLIEPPEAFAKYN